MLFKLLFFLVSVGLLIRFWFIIPIVVIALVIGLVISNRKSRTNVENPDTQEIYGSTTHKVSAAVSPSLYNEMSQYCNRNRMTISELIRKAVRAYMDSN